MTMRKPMKIDAFYQKALQKIAEEDGKQYTAAGSEFQDGTATDHDTIQSDLLKASDLFKTTTISIDSINELAKSVDGSRHAVLNENGDIVFVPLEPGPGDYDLKVRTDDRSSPYFGDSSRVHDSSGIQTISGVNPFASFKLDGSIVLRKFNNKQLLQHIINNMVKQESKVLDSIELGEDDYQFLMNLIYDNFIAVAERRAMKIPEKMENNTVNVSFLDKLNHTLTNMEGIASVQTLFVDYPKQVTILVRIDPKFEFQDEYHVEQWEANLSEVFRKGKPKELDKLEVVFHRTEVF